MTDWSFEGKFGNRKGMCVTICKNSMIPKILLIEIWSVAETKKFATIDPDIKNDIVVNNVDNLFYIKKCGSMRGIGKTSSWYSITSLNF